MPLDVEPGRVPLLTEVVELDLAPDGGEPWPPASQSLDAAPDVLAVATSSPVPPSVPAAIVAHVPASTDRGSDEAVPSAPAGSVPDVDAVVQQVLQRLGPQLDDWLDSRWQAALAPALQRCVDELRASIAPALRGWVADAVRGALAATAARGEADDAPR